MRIEIHCYCESRAEAEEELEYFNQDKYKNMVVRQRIGYPELNNYLSEGELAHGHVLSDGFYYIYVIKDKELLKDLGKEEYDNVIGKLKAAKEMQGWEFLPESIEYKIKLESE